MRIYPVLAAAAILGLILTWAGVAQAQQTQPAGGGTSMDELDAPSGQQEAKPAPTTGGAGAARDARGRQRGSMFPLLILVGGFFLLYIWMGRGRKKEQRRREQMLASLKKNDKVTTIGGIVGTVVEVRNDEITVKVDESSNVRMKFARWAIRGVGEQAKAEKPGREDSEKKP